MKKIKISTPITIKDLAQKLEVGPNEVIAKSIELGEMVTINTALTDEDTITIVVHEFDADAEFITEKPEKEKAPQPEKKHKKKKNVSVKKGTKTRAPVVTFMGHVDHGKTSLLDYLRKSSIIQKESGGITQHIGAYVVDTGHGKITFLDTPGHEAFTAMRARGAIVTDLVVLVIAADDGIMPQTKEALDHCKAAEVPMIVAINKTDLASANIEKVHKQLADRNLMSEEWGGSVITCNVSAKTGDGLDHLLEMVLLQSEMMELTANPDKQAEGVIVESTLSKGRGATATVLVKDGTLKIGDYLVCGTACGRVKSMIDENGNVLKTAGPSTPVEILGLSDVPEAGTEIEVVENEKKAREIVEKRKLKMSQTAISSEELTLEDFYSRMADTELKELKLIIKADVTGSIEAIEGCLNNITSDEVKINILSTGTGDITENDIMLASASKAIIIGFHVKANQKVRDIARREGVDIRIYTVIYTLVEEIEKSLEGLLEPKYKEVVKGHAQVKQVFKISKIGKIAGCMVEDGKISSKDNVRVIRDDEIIYEGKIEALKRFKDEVKEVRDGQECGINIVSFSKLEEGDLIEAYELHQVIQKL